MPVFGRSKIGKTRRFRGRDEADYLPELYRENAVFATADRAFLEANETHRHAGIVWVPEPKDAIAEFAAEAILRIVDERGIHGMRGVVMFPANDGFHVHDGARGEDIRIRWWGTT